MIRNFAIATIIGLMSASASLAKEVPPFFAGTALYVKNLALCPANANGSDINDAVGSLQVNSAGIYGIEFGCTFIDFKVERDPESDVVYSYIGTVQCGDDSGIIRPDLISLIPGEDESQLFLQSQNEYNLLQVLEFRPDPNSTIDPMTVASFVSGQYLRCPKS